MVLLNWMYVVRLFNRNALSQVLHRHSLSNLTMQLLDICRATAKPLWSVTGEIDAEPLVCDNVQRLCIVYFRYSAEPFVVPPLFWAQLSISWVPVSQFVCARLLVNSAEIWVMASVQLKERLWVCRQTSSPFLNRPSSSKSRVPTAALRCLRGASWSQLFRLWRASGPLSCLFPSWAPHPSANHRQYNPHKIWQHLSVSLIQQVSDVWPFETGMC